MPSTADKPVKQALKEIPLLADLSDGEFQWLVDHLEEGHYAAGEVLPSGRARRISDHHPELAKSRLAPKGAARSSAVHRKHGNNNRVAAPVTHDDIRAYHHRRGAERLLRLHKKHFDEMLTVIPQLRPRLLGVMADRIRDTTKMDIQYEKLAALGKLSAGLAHELNNPAAAARSAAGEIRRLLDRLRAADASLNSCRHCGSMAEYREPGGRLHQECVCVYRVGLANAQRSRGAARRVPHLAPAYWTRGI